MKTRTSDVWRNGQVVLVTYLPAKDMNQWVKQLRKASDQPVDWNYTCGRAVVKALGNVRCVQAEVLGLLPLLNELANR